MMHRETIPRVVTKLLFPFMLLFALYVQFHGDYGAGGGFQAGVIIAAAVVLYGLMFGLGAAQAVAPARLVERLIPLGVFIYGGVGVASLLLGGNYLDYFVLSHDTVHGQERGIFWVEVGVLITVSSTLISIYYAFAGRGR
ncbi:MAG: Na(+)/H(+) antiporter subunit B [Acetobacteraceae bacterium]